MINKVFIKIKKYNVHPSNIYLLLNNYNVILIIRTGGFIMLDLSKIKVDGSKDIDPTIIFTNLPHKKAKYGYLRDVQSEVLNSWFSRRDNLDNIIKMNTGSGKTIVALLILQSCLNELNERSVYIVPDNYLVKQVIEEATNLGIKATNDIVSYSFAQKKSILVTTIYSLINGMSKFGMNSSNIDVGSFLIDDVHSCVNIGIDQSTIKISRAEHSLLFDKILEIFSEDLKNQNHANFVKIRENDYTANPMAIPYWSWQKKSEIILELLYKNREDFKFHFPLIEDILELCYCCISYNEIQITPKCLPIHKITKFNQAKRRIFMSATLNDDSVLVTNFDINPQNIKNVIMPRKSNDIGDRMILFPQFLNPNITDEEIKDYLSKKSEEYRIIILVPSFQRAKFWDDIADNTYSRETIDTLKKKKRGLDVLVNRYDGIDLKDDACRILVIDGLPEATSLYQNIKSSYINNSEFVIKEKIQIIEQGMGRGVRSNVDYCCVLLMGKKLIDVLYNQNGISYFSNSCKKQIDLSEKISEQLQNCSLEDIVSNFDYCLRQDAEWVELSKKNLNSIVSNSESSFTDEAIALRKAFNTCLIRDYTKLQPIFCKLLNGKEQNDFYGWLSQEKAEYINLQSKEDAQRIQLKAKAINKKLLFPIRGILPTIKTHKNINQVNNIIQYRKKFTDNTAYIIKVQSILSDLSFIPDSLDHRAPDRFEESIKELGLLLGFESTRPEKELGDGGPDNLWDINENQSIIIECKSGTTTNVISKGDCEQLLSSMQWFETKKQNTEIIGKPIMIHNSKIFAKDANPNNTMRIITPNKLKEFVNNIKLFCEEVNNHYNDQKFILSLINKYSLNTNLIDKYCEHFLTDK